MSLSDADQRQTEPASVTVMGIDIDKVIVVRKVYPVGSAQRRNAAIVECDLLYGLPQRWTVGGKASRLI